MAAIVFTCPVTRQKVSAWIADSPATSDYFEAVECAACKRLHWVNPRTSKVVGSQDK